MSPLKEEFEEKKNQLSEEISDRKEKISDSIQETKNSISTTVDSGVKKTKSFLKKLTLGLFCLAILGGIGYYFFATWTYSDGTRTGTLIKMSKKGNLFKTHEGQLNIGGIQTGEEGLIGNIWNFSVKEDFLYKKLESLEGQKVTLRYKEQYRKIPWQGESLYFVYDIKKKE